MTGKRFIGGSAGVYDKYKENRWLWSEWEEVTEIMNNLDIKARERSKALSKLQNENEQLKQTNQELYDDLQNCMSYEALKMGENSILKKENEQLQKQLSDVRKENYGNLDGINYYQEQNASLSERISDLDYEMEQLTDRNKRQAKHLAELYELMAKKDWEALTEIIEEFCSFEE